MKLQGFGFNPQYYRRGGAKNSCRTFGHWEPLTSFLVISYFSWVSFLHLHSFLRLPVHVSPNSCSYTVKASFLNAYCCPSSRPVKPQKSKELPQKLGSHFSTGFPTVLSPTSFPWAKSGSFQGLQSTTGEKNSVPHPLMESCI